MNDNHKIGTIYIIENDKNNKVYIGQTIHDIEYRFKQHIELAIRKGRVTKLYEAMESIGYDKFHIRELEKCRIEDMNKREVYYIKKYDSYINGYNSTPGGDGSKSIFMELDINKFTQLYNDKVPVLDIAKQLNCSVKTVHLARKALGIAPNHGKFGNSSNRVTVGTAKKLVKYDKYFNAIKIYDYMKDAVEELGKTSSAYYFIRESCIRGNIAYGYRWQYLDDLEGVYKGRTIYFNTIFDKHNYTENCELIKLKSGSFQIKGIIYANYVGESARQKCDVCGTKLNKMNICDKCRIDNNRANALEIKNQRINKIKEMLNEGMNLSAIGRELGISANRVKAICIEDNIFY